MKTSTLIASATLGGALLIGGTWAIASRTMGHGMHAAMMAQHHDATGTPDHDMATMPMLNGVDTTEGEVNDLRALFTDHTKLRRTVERLPDGIRTVTETDDPDLRAALVGHVAAMISRVEDQRDPEIPIQSPTLDPIFAGGPGIVTTMDATETGIAVTQTSDDPAVVAALHTHADEVSDLAARGMDAVHDAMMARR